MSTPARGNGCRPRRALPARLGAGRTGDRPGGDISAITRQPGLSGFGFAARQSACRAGSIAARRVATCAAANTSCPAATGSLTLCCCRMCARVFRAPAPVPRARSSVLVPEGSVDQRLQPASACLGLRRLIARRGAEAPWSGHYRSAMRIRDWLNLLGYFEIQESRFGCYAPSPRTRSGWSAVFDRAGSRWWPVLGRGLSAARGQAGGHAADQQSLARAAKAAASNDFAGRPRDGLTRKHAVTMEAGISIPNPADPAAGAILRSGIAREGDRVASRRRRTTAWSCRGDPPRTRLGPVAALVHTDSQYVQKGISEWIHGWKARGLEDGPRRSRSTRIRGGARRSGIAPPG